MHPLNPGGSVPVGARLLAQQRGNVITEENGSGWRRFLRVTLALKKDKGKSQRFLSQGRANLDHTFVFISWDSMKVTQIYLTKKC